ncbi:MAG: divergent polysaccharide deacetylase family protein [Kordiimonadaceae bacterium]|nr:divergent polysaccharide deacetylase family protein [Kordiimonadaceae bacterium]
MNTETPHKKSKVKALFTWQSYLLKCFYITFIGFCAVGIVIKINNINFTFEEQLQASYAFEEGFGVVQATVKVPQNTTKDSFLKRLTRRFLTEPEVAIKPQRNETANSTWQKYAAAAVIVPTNNAKVILVIDDLGIVKDVSKQMIDMDVPLTLSFLPYASNISRQVNDAYDRGHDILVHIPMEPKGRADPGPHALLSSTSPSVQMDSINYNLSQFSNFIGINNHMGSAFTEDDEAVNRLLNVIKDKGLMVLDSRTTSKSVLEDLAYQKNIPVINRDVFLDNEQDEVYIMGQLRVLERLAKLNGTALAIGHPYPETVAALKRWIPTLAEKGITIVPISQTIKEKYSDTLLAVN